MMQTLNSSLKISTHSQQATPITSSMGSHKKIREPSSPVATNKRKINSLTLAALAVSLAALYFFC